MKAYFPYYFKQIGIILVIISFVFSFLSGLHTHVNAFEDGYNSVKKNGDEQLKIVEGPFNAHVRKNMEWAGVILAFSGLIVYMFSKEKVEDEFIQVLRYKSLAKSFLITWIFVIFIYILKENFNPDPDIFEIRYNTDALGALTLQLFIYAIIYHRKKKKY